MYVGEETYVQSGFLFYMEVDEREKISKKKYATVFAYYR